MPRPEDNEVMGLRVRNKEVKAKWEKKRRESFDHRMEELSKLAMEGHHIAGDPEQESLLLEQIATQNLHW